jgi:hypothetical protein
MIAVQLIRSIPLFTTAMWFSKRIGKEKQIDRKDSVNKNKEKKSCGKRLKGEGEAGSAGAHLMMKRLSNPDWN